MKLRTTFTLWIALFSLCTALLFSAFVYIELMEESDKLLMRELLDTSNAIFSSMHLDTAASFQPQLTDYPVERYFVKIVGADNRVIYASPMVAHVDIPIRPADGFFSLQRQLPAKYFWIDPLEDDGANDLSNDTVRFKALQVSKKAGGQNYTISIAKPLAMMTFELKELFFELLAYIALTIIVIVFLSYFLAGKLLNPLDSINRKIKAIREQSLNERIPLRKSKDELYTLTVSLNTMFDRLQQSFEQQKQFISSASHEMKIPLTIIMLGHEQMLSHNLPDEIKIELSKQLNNLQRLNRLVKDLLAISHLEHKEFIELRPIRLSQLIDKVLEDFDEMLQAGNISCTSQVERLQVMADHDKIIRVFINLLDNAIKYNLPSGGRIDIVARKRGETAEITISNSGRQIPENDLPHVFSQFYRVEKSRSVQYGGSGLGLTIVKRIVELHGGTISVESDKNQTSFTFTLSLAEKLA